MTNDSAGDGGAREDRAWPGGVRWEFGGARGHIGETLWRCNALRAGRLYNRSLFGTRVEAEEFAVKMREIEPDQMFSVEAISASALWN